MSVASFGLFHRIDVGQIHSNDLGTVVPSFRYVCVYARLCVCLVIPKHFQE